MILRGAHIGLIARHYVKHNLRGGAGLVFVFLAMVVGLLCAQITLGSVNTALKLGGSPGQILQLGTKALDWLLSPDSEQLQYLTVARPVLISAVLCSLLIVIPFLMTLGGFNQTSGDIASKGLRYLLQRTERSNLYLGRLIGSYLFSLIVLAVLFLVLALYCVAKLKTFHAQGDMVLWLLGGFWRCAILAMPYMALCAWVSAAIDSPFGSLVIANLFVLYVPLIGWVANGIKPGVGTALGYLMPAGYKWWLMEPGFLMPFMAVVVMLGFTALLTWLGMRYFDKRDL